MTDARAPRPAFVQELSAAHYAELSRCVVLTGNIHDLFPVESDSGVSSRARYPRRGGTESFVILGMTGGRVSFPVAADAAELQSLGTSLSGSPDDAILASLGRRVTSVLEGC
jgi:hypothetical protein